MVWLPVVLMASILSSSGVCGVIDNGQPIKSSQFTSVDCEQNFSACSQYNENREINTYEPLHDNDVDSWSYSGSSTPDNSGSLSDNVPDNVDSDPEDPEEPEESENTGSAISSEEWGEFRGQLSSVFDNIETHQIEEQAAIDKILEIVILVAGMLLFITLCEVLKYIYKFFRIFF